MWDYVAIVRTDKRPNETSSDLLLSENQEFYA